MTLHQNIAFKCIRLMQKMSVVVSFVFANKRKIPPDL